LLVICVSSLCLVFSLYRFLQFILVQWFTYILLREDWSCCYIAQFTFYYSIINIISKV
jgi:hypothetical protein